MASNDQLQEAKRRTSGALLALAPVSGLGISGGKLVVYLAEDSEAIRNQVLEIVRQQAPGVEATIVVTGAFEKQ